MVIGNRGTTGGRKEGVYVTIVLYTQQGYIESLLIEIHSKQRRMGCILESIKSSLASMYPVVNKNLGNFPKDLDDDFSSNLS